MPVLTIGLVAGLWLVVPAQWVASVPVVKGPVRCDVSVDRPISVSGRVVLVGHPLTGKEGVVVHAVAAGQLPKGEVRTSDVVRGFHIDKDGKYGPIEMPSGLALTAMAPGFEPASVMVTCSATIDFVLVPIPSSGE